MKSRNQRESTLVKNLGPRMNAKTANRLSIFESFASTCGKLLFTDSDPSLCSGFQKSYPNSSSIPDISVIACLFPVRFAASTPFSSIFLASAVRPLRSRVCAAMKYPLV